MHDESYIGNLHIDILYLICGICSNQKNYIVTYGSETGASRGLLGFSYKLFVGKHVFNITIPIISLIYETGLVFDDEMVYVSPLSGQCFSPFRAGEKSYSQGFDL